MYAVISYPRSGSRNLAKKFSLELDLPIGYLHHAKSVRSYCLNYAELTCQDYVLHSHWHTVHLLPESFKQHIETNYKIVHIERDLEHVFLSAIITMSTGNIDFKSEDIPEIIEPGLVDEFFKRMEPTKKNMLDWRIDICYNFDEIYNNTSSTNFIRNREKVKNYDELYKRYVELNA